MPRQDVYRDGGSRGGADQFKWKDVETEKYRELYLGHSVMAPIGRWQRGKDLHWYTKGKKEQADILKDEIAAVKAQELELQNQALGLAPKRRTATTAQLDQNEVKAMLERGNTERESIDAERQDGLGAAPAKGHDHIKQTKTLAERYQARLEKKQDPNDDSWLHQIGGSTQSVGGGQDVVGTKREARQDVDSDTERKRAKKEKKKVKKELKKEKKKEKKEKKKLKKERR